jgi:sialidase-1
MITHIYSILLAFFFILINNQGFSQPITVFKSGTDGHKSYRIPAIISLPNGDLLAFAEGRVNNSADFGDINLVMKRSQDKGKTWSPMETLVDQDRLQAGNPAPVVDLCDPDYPNGVVYLFYNTGNNHESEVRKGNGVREVLYIKSYDFGKTWDPPVNITLQTHKPFQPTYDPNYKFKEGWRTYANTPGHAFQFLQGLYKGRIYIAANHSANGPKERYTDHYAHGFYTDDHGKTFKISDNIKIPGSNEAIATELSNNRMMMSVRNQKGDIRRRILAYSSDGGASWDTAYFDQQLPDPVCQGTLLTLGYKKGKAIVAHCNAADEKLRDNLTLRISEDEGKTWKTNIVIDKSAVSGKRDWTAYSDLVKVGKKIGVLYERDGYAEIVFKVVSWK